MNIKEWTEHDKITAAHHEAGHFIVAKHFKVVHSSLLIATGKKPTTETKCFVGKTIYRGTTRFREAAIAWAGPLAEEMARNGQSMQAWQSDCDTLWEHFEFGDLGAGRISEVSCSDLEAINAHPMKRRAFNTAVSILSKNFEETKRVAAVLIEDGCIDASL
jgi:hypothetical protein